MGIERIYKKVPCRTCGNFEIVKYLDVEPYNTEPRYLAGYHAYENATVMACGCGDTEKLALARLRDKMTTLIEELCTKKNELEALINE